MARQTTFPWIHAVCHIHGPLLYLLGVIELDNFVQIASATGAGGHVQDELEHAKLHDLQFLGDAFGPLLYDVRPNSGADVLFERWSRVWTSVSKDGARIQEIIVS